MFGFLNKGATHEARINGKSIHVEADETLLLAALRQNVEIPNICRVGGCGSCKCKLKSGKVHELTESAYLLSEEEIAEGYILACQSRLKSDIDVEMDESAAITSAPVTGGIVGREFLTHDIVRVDVQLDQPINYKAGQFAELTLDSAKDAPRSYSFSNAPDKQGRVSFTIRRVPGGRFSTYVFDNYVEGETLTVRGPGGDFWLREGKEKVVFISGGSGLAPMLGMLEEMERKGDRRPVTLMFGARTEQDLYELKRLEAYANNWPEFRFVPILSEDDSNHDWNGLRGLVTDHIRREAAGATQAYLCGPPQMIDAAIKELKENNIAAQGIYADRFVVREVKNTGFYGAVGLPTVERTPATIGDYLKFMMFHLMGVIAVFAYLAGGAWISAGFASFLGFYVLGDMLTGDDKVTPEYRKPWILTVQLWLALPLLLFIGFCFSTSIHGVDLA